jgi:hypothetical protein
MVNQRLPLTTPAEPTMEEIPALLPQTPKLSVRKQSLVSLVAEEAPNMLVQSAEVLTGRRQMY